MYDAKVEELITFTKKWAEDLRQNLHIPDTGKTIGLSFQPEFALPCLPETSVLEPGIYESVDGTMKVEVVTHPTPYQVVFEIMEEGGDKITTEMMSPGIFTRLFKKAKLKDLDSLSG